MNVGLAAAIYILALSATMKAWLRTSVAIGVLLAVLILFPQNTAREQFSLTATSATVIVIALASLTSPASRSSLVWFTPLLVFLCVGLVLIWSTDMLRIEGAANLLLGVAGWSAGAFLATHVPTDSRPARLLAVFVLLVIGAETVVMVLQTAGLDIFAPVGRTLEIVGDRANGTYVHPSVVGKVVLLVLPLLLPLTRSSDNGTARVASVATFVGILPVALSESRSNFIAVIATILIWSFIQPSSRRTKPGRLLMPAGVIGVGLVFLKRNPPSV